MKKVLLSRLSMAALLVATTFIAQPIDTQASGFYIREFGPDVGRAFAGTVAGGYDASTIYANPAGMMLLKQPEVEGGGTFIFSKTTFTNIGSTVPAGTGIVLGADNGGDPFDTPFVPSLYVLYPFEHISFGLGISVPFGLETKYNDGWIGRFDSIKAELETINFAPTVAFDVTDWMTFGVGADIQYADAELIRAKTVPLGIIIGGVNVGGTELRSKLKGDDWSFGINAGVIVKATEDLNIGVNFHSGTTHALEGDASIVAASGVAAIDAIVDGALVAAGNNLFQARADLRLPHIFTIGASWDATDRWNLGLQAQWFNWNRFNEIRITNAAPLVGAAGPVAAGTTIDLVPENYKNTFAIAVGSEYCITPDIKWQLGYMYDQTPTRDGFRDTAVPDSNRNWITTGLIWEFMPGVSVNVGYAHIFISDETVNVTRATALGATNPAAPGANPATILGTLDSHADLVSINGRIEF